MEGPVDCITKHALYWAPIEKEGVECVFGGGGGRGGVVVGVHHVFFIYMECLSVSQERDGGWICGSSKSRVPGREEGGRERGRDRKEGGRAAETVQEMQCLLWKEGEGCGAGGSLFDLRSGGLI